STSRQYHALGQPGGRAMFSSHRMRHSVVATVLFVATVAGAMSRAAHTASPLQASRASAKPAGWTMPRTAWGDPDFAGVWNYATMTPLERPREFADKDVLTADEAAAYERRILERQSTTNNTAGPDWWDSGTRRLA